VRDEAVTRRLLEPDERVELAFRATSGGDLPYGPWLTVYQAAVFFLSGGFFSTRAARRPYLVALTDQRLALIALNPWTGRGCLRDSCPRDEASLETFPPSTRRTVFGLNLANRSHTLHVRPRSRNQLDKLATLIPSYRQHLNPKLLRRDR
jgi:hypothetical protein